MPRNNQHIIFALLMGLALPSVVFSEIYRWVDDNGKFHFTDKPPVSHSSEQVKLRINTYDAVTYDTSSFDVGKRVVMYSASWCGVCKKAKRYFVENGIQFTEYDIEKSVKGKVEFKKLGAKGVPVILVGNRRMNGFSIDGFKQLYR